MASDNMTLSLGVLAEKYGEIYSLKVGSKKSGEHVFLNIYIYNLHIYIYINMYVCRYITMQVVKCLDNLISLY